MPGTSLRVAVTGAAGLLGRHVGAALAAEGHEVIGIDRPGRGAARGADLTAPGAARAALAGAEALVHAAAIPRPNGSTPEAVFSTNVGATFAVLEAAEALGVARVILASSFSVLGLPVAPRPVRLAALPVDGSHPAAPQDAYALSKWLSEETVEAWTRRTGGRAVSLRMPWLQGPDTFRREVLPRRERAEARLDLWGYLDLRDAGAAFVAALTRTAAPGEGHDRLFVAAADSYSETPSADLVRAHWPGVPLGDLPGHASLISSARAGEVLGWRPRHGWRDYRSEDRP
jgi:nucleoside-diphosphate-sugar epimerase